MAFIDRARRSRFPARFFFVAEFEFYPATRHLAFDAFFELYAGAKKQPANH